MRTKASLDKIPHRRSPTTETARSADHRSSEHILLRLQRQIGNQAVGRLLHQPGGLTVIQRLSLYNTDWSRVTRMRLSSSGQSGVLFVEDNTPNGLVLKKGGDTDPALETQVAHTVHQKLSKGKAKVPGIRLATEEDKKQLRLLALEKMKVTLTDLQELRGIDPLIAENPFHRPTTPEEFRTRFAVDFFTGDVVIMTKASGETFEKIVETKQAVAKGLLSSPDYVQRLGFVTAVDLFLGNTDRLFYANLGNWMTNISRYEETLTLIDNFDPVGFGAQRFNDASQTAWEDSAKPRLQNPDNTATEVKNALDPELKKRGVQLTDAQWEDFKKYFVRGMKKGIDRILSKLAPRIGRRSRTLKRGITQVEGGEAAWSYLKERARLLRR